MQPPVEREAEEEEKRGGSKIYGVTNYWQQLVLSQLPRSHLELLSKVSTTKFHLFFFSAGFLSASRLKSSFENSFEVDTREMEKYEERH